MSNDDRFFIHDAASAQIRNTSDVESDSFSLDVARTVQIDNPPWVEAFDTDRFHEFEVVAARPIKQTYVVDGEEFTFEKPPEELRAAAWSMDNNPYPIGHPLTGSVQTPDDVHGFLRNPKYVDDYDDNGDALTANLYVPVNDEVALDHIADYQDVSVGFFNRLDWDTDSENVDAYQRDLLFDHVAGVTVGRCSGEDGCGIEIDEGERDSTVLRVGESDEGHTTFREECSDGPCSCGLHEDSDISNTETMSEEETSDEAENSPEIDLDSVVSSMSLDALAERHEDVKELQNTVDEKDTEIESKEDRIEVLEDAKDDLEQTVEEFENGERRPKKVIVDSILDMTERWDEEELMDLDRERLEDREGIVSDVAATPSTPSTDDAPSTDEEPETTDDAPTTESTDGHTISMDNRSWSDD